VTCGRISSISPLTNQVKGTEWTGASGFVPITLVFKISDYIHALLCNIGTHVDPQILVRKIEDGMEIPGLRDSLVKIMQDYSLQVSLQEGCKNILVGDCLVLFEKLVRVQLHGVLLEGTTTCICDNTSI